jgi:hypothetical protein
MCCAIADALQDAAYELEQATERLVAMPVSCDTPLFDAAILEVRHVRDACREYRFVVLAHHRRRVVHFAVTADTTAEWAAHQILQAFPWDSTPRYLLRDRDRIFGSVFVHQLEVMGIEQVLLAPVSPWQRAYYVWNG